MLVSNYLANVSYYIVLCMSLMSVARMRAYLLSIAMNIIKVYKKKIYIYIELHY